jgi:hypothetical protein
MGRQLDQKQRLDPMTPAKRARQEEARRRVETGEQSLESMFLISLEIVRTIRFRRQTDDF